MKAANDISPDTYFIIAPIRGPFKIEKERVLEAQKIIEAAGYKTISFYDLFSPLTEEDIPAERTHMRKSIPYVVMVDQVLTFPHWETDIVATQQIKIAQVLQTKVIPIEKFLLNLKQQSEKITG